MIRLLKTYLKPYAGQLILVMALLLVQALTNLFLPSLNADIINNGVAKGDIAYITRIGAVMLGVTALMGVAAVVGVYFGSRTAMAFGRDVRAALFRHVVSFAQTEVNTFGTPSLITRNTNDVQQVQQVVMMALNMMILAPVMGIGGIIMALREDVALSAILVVVIPIMTVFIALVVRKAMPLFKAVQIKVDRINQVVRETLSGVRVIRAFVRDDYERQRFEAANEDLTDTSIKVGRIFAFMIPSLFGLLNLTTVAVMWFGSIRVASGGMPIGNLTAYLTYISMILMAVMMGTVMFAMVPRAAASADRIQAVLDTEPSVTSLANPTALPSDISGRIEFRDVEFRYPGAEDPVLRNINFSAGPGEVTAIVGSTGSGKSTLVNLIPRFYDVSAGAVLIDGVDIRELSPDDLWRTIGFVPQRAFLFSGTVADNLRYGDVNATDEELWRCLTIAQGKQFISEMPEQLEATISQGGTSVSGGQRQRLAIARALVKRPEIYVFDDSFSALDFKTDSQLRAALKAETADATVIVVAQRVSTIMTADRIIVMECGTIAGMGTHAELMESSETYREIVYSQMSQEEVA
ncbi:MAG: ABC transporter ATP-binding protein [Coriobacteriia bacterium]|nr:ABC transporter ATP-binding protein [Coriobacteriia bacterium]